MAVDRQKQFEALKSSLRDISAPHYYLLDGATATFKKDVQGGSAVQRRSDHLHFLWSIEYWDSLTKHERIFMTAHLCQHLLSRHFSRLGSKLKGKKTRDNAELAIDLAANHTVLRKFNFTDAQLPTIRKTGAFVDTVRPELDMDDSLSAEEYYFILNRQDQLDKEQQREADNQDEQDDKDDDGEDESDQKGKGKSKSKDSDDSDESAEGGGKGKGKKSKSTAGKKEKKNDDDDDSGSDDSDSDAGDESDAEDSDDSDSDSESTSDDEVDEDDRDDRDDDSHDVDNDGADDDPTDEDGEGVGDTDDGEADGFGDDSGDESDDESGDDSEESDEEGEGEDDDGGSEDEGDSEAEPGSLDNHDISADSEQDISDLLADVMAKMHAHDNEEGLEDEDDDEMAENTAVVEQAFALPAGTLAGSGITGAVNKPPPIVDFNPAREWRKFGYRLEKSVRTDKGRTSWMPNNKFVGLTQLHKSRMSLPSYTAPQKSQIRVVVFLDTSASCVWMAPVFTTILASMPKEIFSVTAYTFTTRCMPCDIQRPTYSSGGTSFDDLEAHFDKEVAKDLAAGKSYQHYAFVLTDGDGTIFTPKIPEQWYFFMNQIVPEPFEGDTMADNSYARIMAARNRRMAAGTFSSTDSKLHPRVNRVELSPFLPTEVQAALRNSNMTMYSAAPIIEDIMQKRSRKSGVELPTMQQVHRRYDSY